MSSRGAAIVILSGVQKSLCSYGSNYEPFMQYYNNDNTILCP